ncbi:unnamed protein product [Camellia sinensis]
MNFKVDPMMEKLGTKMVEQCGGIPLAWRTSRNKAYLEPLAYSASKYWLDHTERRVSDVLALSYQDLSYLKACFLYCGNYPEDFDIEVETLYQLWMAEGFISQEEREEEETKMDVAECYLGELAQRCMVQVELQPDEEYSITKESKRFKHCRLHDLMRDLCLSKVKEENFLNVTDYQHRNEQGRPSSLTWKHEPVLAKAN